MAFVSFNFNQSVASTLPFFTINQTSPIIVPLTSVRPQTISIDIVQTPTNQGGLNFTMIRANGPIITENTSSRQRNLYQDYQDYQDLQDVLAYARANREFYSTSCSRVPCPPKLPTSQLAQYKTVASKTSAVGYCGCGAEMQYIDFMTYRGYYCKASTKPLGECPYIK